MSTVIKRARPSVFRHQKVLMPQPARSPPPSDPVDLKPPPAPNTPKRKQPMFDTSTGILRTMFKLNESGSKVFYAYLDARVNFRPTFRISSPGCSGTELTRAQLDFLFSAAEEIDEFFQHPEKPVADTIDAKTGMKIKLDNSWQVPILKIATRDPKPEEDPDKIYTSIGLITWQWIVELQEVITHVANQMMSFSPLTNKMYWAMFRVVSKKMRTENTPLDAEDLLQLIQLSDLEMQFNPVFDAFRALCELKVFCKNKLVTHLEQEAERHASGGD